jgi:hypothetical protein
LRRLADALQVKPVIELGHMTRVRNVLISFGVFWLSVWMVVPLAWLFGKLNNGIIYGDSVLAAIAMGVMTSLGRAFAASVAGGLVTLTAAGRKPERWAFIIAILYVVDAPVRRHWHLPPTGWDRLWQSVDLLFPAIVCVAAAFMTVRFRRARDGAGPNEKES